MALSISSLYKGMDPSSQAMPAPESSDVALEDLKPKAGPESADVALEDLRPATKLKVPTPSPFMEGVNRTISGAALGGSQGGAPGAVLGAVGANIAPAYSAFQEKYIKEHPEQTPWNQFVKGAIDIPAAAMGAFEFPHQIAQRLAEPGTIGEKLNRAAATVLAPAATALGITDKTSAPEWYAPYDPNRPVSSMLGIAAPALMGLGALRGRGAAPEVPRVEGWKTEPTGFEATRGPYDEGPAFTGTPPATGAEVPTGGVPLPGRLRIKDKFLGGQDFVQDPRVLEQSNAQIEAQLQGNAPTPNIAVGPNQAGITIPYEDFFGKQEPATERPLSNLPQPGAPATPAVGQELGQDVGRVPTPPLLTEHPVQVALREVYPDMDSARLEAEQLERQGGPSLDPVYIPGVGYQNRLKATLKGVGPELEDFYDALDKGNIEQTSPEEYQRLVAQVEANRAAEGGPLGPFSNLDEKIIQVQEHPLSEPPKAPLEFVPEGTEKKKLLGQTKDLVTRDVTENILNGQRELDLAMKDPETYAQLQGMASKQMEMLNTEIKQAEIDSKTLQANILAEAIDDFNTGGPDAQSDVAKAQNKADAERWLNEKGATDPHSFESIVDNLGLGDADMVRQAILSGKADSEAIRGVKFYSGLGFVPEAVKMIRDGLDKLSESNFGEAWNAMFNRYTKGMGIVPDPKANLYTNSNNRMSAHESANDINAFLFARTGKELYDRFANFDPREGINVADMVETGRGVLSAMGKDLAKIWSDSVGALGNEAVKWGVLRGARSDFYTHILLDGPQVEDIKSGKNYELQRSWFLKPRSEEAYTMRELQDKGYKLMTDPRDIIPLYIYSMKREILKAQLATDLFAMRTADGYPTLIDSKATLPPGVKDQYVTPRAEVNRFFTTQFDRITRNLGGSDVGGTTLSTHGEFLIHKDAYRNIESVLGTLWKDESFLLGRQILADLRRFNLLNPTIHGNNVLSSYMQILGTGLLKNDWILTDAEKLAGEDRFIRGGGKPTNLFDIQKLLVSGEYEPRIDAKNLSKIWEALKADPGSPARALLEKPITSIGEGWKIGRAMLDHLLWDKIVWPLQLRAFLAESDRIAKLHPELPQETADRAAAIFTNDMFGTMQRSTATLGQQKFSSIALLAPRWTPSIIREMVGGLNAIPRNLSLEKGTPSWGISESKLFPKIFRVEGIDPALQKTMGKEYLYALARGAVGLVIWTNFLQFMASQYAGQEYTPTWTNAEGHKMDVRLYKSNEQDKEEYLKSNFFRQTEDMTKMLTGDAWTIALNKTHPIWRELVSQALNYDRFSKSEIKKDFGSYGPVEFPRLEHAFLNLTPIGQVTGTRPDAKRDWAETLFPFVGAWVTHGMGTTPEMSDMLKNFSQYKAYHQEQGKQARIDINHALRSMDQESASAYISEALRNGVLTPGQVAQIPANMAAPMLFKVMTVNGRLNPDFVKFLSTLPQAKQAEYMKAFSDATKQSNQQGLMKEEIIKPPGGKPIPGRSTGPTVGEGTQGLMNELIQRGTMGEPTIRRDEANKYENQGVFSPQTRALRATISPEGGASYQSYSAPTLSHEMTHALQTSNLPSRTTEVLKQVEVYRPGFIERLFGSPELVTPSSWERGQIENPGIEKIRTKDEYVNEPSFLGIKSPQEGDYYRGMARNKMVEALQQSIPKSENWSGLDQKFLAKRQGSEMLNGDMAEVQAYFLTSPTVKGDINQRAHQYGMFLRDFNLPWNVVEGAVNDLKSAFKERQALVPVQ